MDMMDRMKWGTDEGRHGGWEARKTEAQTMEGTEIQFGAMPLL
jgi:hypothetical protein